MYGRLLYSSIYSTVLLGLGGPWVQVEETTWVLGGFGPVIPIVLGSVGPMGRPKSTIPVSGHQSPLYVLSYGLQLQKYLGHPENTLLDT